MAAVPEVASTPLPAEIPNQNPTDFLRNSKECPLIFQMNSTGLNGNPSDFQRKSFEKVQWYS